MGSEVEGCVREKKSYLEILRIVSMFFVIVNHTIARVFLPIPPSLTWYAAVTYLFVCKVAVPIFLMISGITLLTKTYTMRKSLLRAGRMALTLLVISAWYYLTNQMEHGSTLSVVKFLQSIWTSHLSNALWYLYVYIGILLMLPILQKLTAAMGKKDLLLAIGLSLVQPTIAMISIWFPSLNLTQYTYESFFSAYLGMMFLGVYLERYTPPDSKKIAIMSILIFIGLIFVQVYLTRELYQINPESYRQMDNRCFPTIILSSAACFYIVRYWDTVHPCSPKMAIQIKKIGALTFGGYLVGDYVIAKCQPFYLWCVESLDLNALLAVIPYQVMVAGISLGIAWVLKQIPGMRNLIS